MFFTGAKRRHYELTLVSSNRMIPHYHREFPAVSYSRRQEAR